jgi:hypothetical protein
MISIICLAATLLLLSLTLLAPSLEVPDSLMLRIAGAPHTSNPSWLHPLPLTLLAGRPAPNGQVSKVVELHDVEVIGSSILAVVEFLLVLYGVRVFRIRILSTELYSQSLLTLAMHLRALLIRQVARCHSDT